MKLQQTHGIIDCGYRKQRLNWNWRLRNWKHAVWCLSADWPEHCDDPTWLSEATDVDGMWSFNGLVLVSGGMRSCFLPPFWWRNQFPYSVILPGVPVPTSRALEVAGRHRAFFVFAAMRKKRPDAVFFWGNPRCHWTAARSKQVNAGQRVRCGSSADWWKGRFTSWLKQVDNWENLNIEMYRKGYPVDKFLKKQLGLKPDPSKLDLLTRNPCRACRFACLVVRSWKMSCARSLRPFLSCQSQIFAPAKDSIAKHLHGTSFFQICTHINTYHI